MANMLHDIIKIKYIYQGYLPNLPYHLISEYELFHAFFSYDIVETDNGWDIENPSGYLIDTYPCLFGSAVLNTYTQNGVDVNYTVADAYHALLIKIVTILEGYYAHLNVYDKDADIFDDMIPDWVYSYMLGIVVNSNSSIKDRHDLLVLLGTDNIYDDIDMISTIRCYNTSKAWLNKIASDRKDCPTIFGEPHVIKALRLNNLVM